MAKRIQQNIIIQFCWRKNGSLHEMKERTDWGLGLIQFSKKLRMYLWILHKYHVRNFMRQYKWVCACAIYFLSLSFARSLSLHFSLYFSMPLYLFFSHSHSLSVSHSFYSYRQFCHFMVLAFDVRKCIAWILWSIRDIVKIGRIKLKQNKLNFVYKSLSMYWKIRMYSFMLKHPRCQTNNEKSYRNAEA